MDETPIFNSKLTFHKEKRKAASKKASFKGFHEGNYSLRQGF